MEPDTDTSRTQTQDIKKLCDAMTSGGMLMSVLVEGEELIRELRMWLAGGDPSAEDIVNRVAEWLHQQPLKAASLALKEITKKPKKKADPKIRRLIPDDWRPAKALSRKGEEELVKFRNYHIAKGNRFLDIERAFLNWDINAGGICFAAEPLARVNGHHNGQVYVKFADREPWDRYGRSIGQDYPRDKDGGWWFPSAVPPIAANGHDTVGE